MAMTDTLRLAAVVAAGVVAALLLVAANQAEAVTTSATSGVERWSTVKEVSGTITYTYEFNDRSEYSSDHGPAVATKTLRDTLTAPVTLSTIILSGSGGEWWIQGTGMAQVQYREESKSVAVETGEIFHHELIHGETAVELPANLHVYSRSVAWTSYPDGKEYPAGDVFSANLGNAASYNVLRENLLTGESRTETKAVPSVQITQPLPAEGFTLSGSAVDTSKFNTATITLTETWNLTGTPAGKVEITKLNLKDPHWKNDIDIDGFQPLEALSTDNHPYYNGNTRIFGAITVTGPAKDTLDSVVLYVTGPGGVVAKAHLSDAARDALRKQFGADNEVSFASTLNNQKPLFLLPSAQADLLDSDENGNAHLQAVATTLEGRRSPSTAAAPASVPRLVRYTDNNRYGCCNQAQGGDTWVRPMGRTAAASFDDFFQGTLWGDFSNMNGGHILPHASHRDGRDVDGANVHYNVRTDDVARDLISALRGSPHSVDIQQVYVTFNRPNTPRANWLKCEGGHLDTSAHGDFWRAIQNEQIPARGGGSRAATDVIRPVAQHCRHFHLRFFPN